MNRRCLNCMNVFMVPEGYEDDDNCCPFCGFIENTLPQNVSYLRIGVVLKGRYTVGTVIGAGGFGITYKAWDNTLDTIVAVKEFFPQGIVLRDNTTTKTNTVSVYNVHDDSYEHGKERFLKEAKSLAKFNSHPGTVAIYDYFEENDTAYIVMEYLDGCNMKEYVAASGTLPSFEMLQRMTESVCDVLEAVRSVGLIHRDISPDNIFMCQNGNFKLIDFGSVKQGINNNNLSATVILKHGYAPIEQYTKTGKVGPWTDIYSLGATIYKLATGVLPQESVERISEDEVVDICELNGSIPRSFGDAVMKALSPQMKDRYQTISEFRADLETEVPVDNIEIETIELDTIDETIETIEDKNDQQEEKTKFDTVGFDTEGLDSKYVYEFETKEETDWQIEETEDRISKIKEILLFLNSPMGRVLITIVIFVIIGILFFIVDPGGEEENNNGSSKKINNVTTEATTKVVTTEATTKAVTTEEATKKEKVKAKVPLVLREVRINCDEEDRTNNYDKITYGAKRIYYHFKILSGEDTNIYLNAKWTWPNGEIHDFEMDYGKPHWNMDPYIYNYDDSPLEKGEYKVEIHERGSDEVLRSKTFTIE